MFKFKKISSIVLAAIMAISVSATVSAQEENTKCTQKNGINFFNDFNVQLSLKNQQNDVLTNVYSNYNLCEEIQNARDGISEIPIDEDKINLYAEVIDANGKSIPIDVDATISCYTESKPLNRSFFANSSDNSKIYVMTVVTKDTNNEYQTDILSSKAMVTRSSKTHDDSETNYGVCAYGTIVWKDNTFPKLNEMLSCKGGWTISAPDSSVTGNRFVEYGDWSSPVDLDSCRPTKNEFEISDIGIKGNNLRLYTSASVKNSSGKEGKVRLYCNTSIWD